MIKLIIRIILIILVLIGVIFIYDARILNKKFFNLGDLNEGTDGIKIIGFILVIISGIILNFLK